MNYQDYKSLDEILVEKKKLTDLTITLALLGNMRTWTNSDEILQLFQKHVQERIKYLNLLTIIIRENIWNFTENIIDDRCV